MTFTSGMRTSLTDKWNTPRDFFDKINTEFDFGLDAAALESSTLVPDNWYGLDHPDISRRDAFTRDWYNDSNGKAIWLNPPYGRVIKDWMSKANSVASNGATVVCLVPSRTDTAWWHEYCVMHEIRFVRGRIKFGNTKKDAPFSSSLIIMRGSK